MNRFLVSEQGRYKSMLSCYDPMCSMWFKISFTVWFSNDSSYAQNNNEFMKSSVSFSNFYYMSSRVELLVTSLYVCIVLRQHTL